jgi:hypothetical protein
MIRPTLAAAILAASSALAQAQSASSLLIVRATVVSSCKVDVPRSVEPSALPTLPVAVTCARGGAQPRVQRPSVPRRSDVRDAVLVIDF